MENDIDKTLRSLRRLPYNYIAVTQLSFDGFSLMILSMSTSPKCSSLFRDIVYFSCFKLFFMKLGINNFSVILFSKISSSYFRLLFITDYDTLNTTHYLRNCFTSFSDDNSFKIWYCSFFWHIRYCFEWYSILLNKINYNFGLLMKIQPPVTGSLFLYVQN